MIFIDPCERESVQKSLTYCQGKSWDSLLTYWLPMKSIFFFIGRIQGHQFRCNYLRSKNLFLSFFVSFLKSRLNFEHFDRKDDPHTFCFSEITDSENVVRKMSKKSCLREPFAKEDGKCDQALFKSASQHVYHIHQSLPRKVSWKKSLLLTWQILGLLVNTLATDEKYPVLNRANLTIPIQMQLPQKQKRFPQFFAAFLKFRKNSELFE